MNQETIIENTRQFVKQTLKNAEGGHDWFHIERVVRNSLQIAQEEKVDVFIVELGALLHDIADSKFHNGDETIGPLMARDFLDTQHLDKKSIDHIVRIIENISFKGGNFLQEFSSPELAVIQDADRLDALGAVGIARAFNYGGYKGRPLFDPSVKPKENMSPEEYKRAAAPTINHFFEKLLLLKDRMNTDSGKRLATQRHNFMELYLKQFFNEVGNVDNFPG